MDIEELKTQLRYRAADEESNVRGGDASHFLEQTVAAIESLQREKAALITATQDLAAKAVEATMRDMEPKLLKMTADAAMAATASLNDQVKQLQRELEEARRLLAHAVKEADGWHDECRGGPIKDDPIMDAARQQTEKG